MPMMRIIRLVLEGICIAYLLLLVLSHWASSSLPHFRGISDRTNTCYWTDALIMYVECGMYVPYSEILNFFLNFWMYPFYGPYFVMLGFGSGWFLMVISFISTLVVYLPFFILFWLAYTTFRKPKTGR